MTSSEAVPWLNDIEMTAWRAYVDTYADLEAALDTRLKPHGLNLGDYQVLVFLSEAQNRSLRMCDLAERLHLSPSGLTRRLDGLVQAKWVARSASDQDRRVMWAVLTDAGQAELTRVAPHHVASVRHFLIDRLTREQLETMADIFTLVRTGLDHDAH